MPNGRRDESAWSRLYDWWRWVTGPQGDWGSQAQSKMMDRISPYLRGGGGAPTWGPSVQPVVPGQYTPSQGFGEIPYQGIQGPYAPTGWPVDARDPWREGMGRRATPGTIPTQEGWIQPAIGGITTPVEAALARIGELAAGQQPAEPERPEAQFPGYWEAIGQQPGNYPVPQGAVQGMWGPRRPWEEWSWRTRGIPLQGNEILRVEGGRMPWGGRGGGGRRRGGGGKKEPEAPSWQPGAWSGTF